ncbi:MAG TPA: DUF5947 family protein [Gemmatimonadaceae bacterium]|jgi:hypothetical protein
MDTQGSRLARLAAQARTPSREAPVVNVSQPPVAAAAVEQCELCSAVVPSEHQHLIDLTARRLVCACRACALLFSDATVSGRQYRLVPDTVRRLDSVAHDDQFWAELAIPVDLAFFFFDTAAKRVVALYPGPMGAAESQLPLGAWDAFAAENPALANLRPDVEALLVNRTKQRRDHWIVPIDACYTLAGLIRTHWKGLGGGDDVWIELGKFFDGLQSRAIGASH